MSTEQILFLGISGCVTAICALFGIEQKRHGATTRELELTRGRLDECERVRFNTAMRVSKLEAGCSIADCPLRKQDQNYGHPQ